MSVVCTQNHFFSSTLSKESIFTCQLKGQMIEKFRKYNRNEEFLKSSNISSKFCSWLYSCKWSLTETVK